MTCIKKEASIELLEIFDMGYFWPTCLIQIAAERNLWEGQSDSTKTHNLPHEREERGKMWDDRYRRPGQRIREARGISEREVRVGKEDQDEGEEVCKSSPWSGQTSLVGIKAHGSLGFSDAGSSTEVLSVVTEPNRNLSSFLRKKIKLGYRTAFKDF